MAAAVEHARQFDQALRRLWHRVDDVAGQHMRELLQVELHAGIESQSILERRLRRAA